MDRPRQEHIITTLIWWTLIISALVFLLLNSCSDSDSNAPSDEQEFITISPFIETGMSKINGNEFEENDAIGLYVVPYEQDNVTPGNIETATYAVNAEHNYHESSWLLPSGGKLAWPSATRPVDLYAYFPYDPALNELNPTQYSFTVNADQRTKLGYQSSDFLWSNTAGVSPTRQPVELIFGHRLSKVKVNVRSEVEILEDDVQNAVISILNINPTGIINLGDGSVSASGNNTDSSVITYKHITPALGYLVSTEGIIIPQQATEGQPFIRIELPSNGTRYHYIPSATISFEPGTERAINITITRLGLSVTVSEISEWQPTEIIEGEIGTPLPRVLDIENLDWNSSRIHRIYNNGLWIGEVCREYLRGNGIDAQAIVIYTVDAQGSLNINTGFVAQVMSYNSGTFEYTPSTSSIHGGRVNWATGNSINSYSAGKSAAIKRIVFLDDGTLAEAPDTYIPTLLTTPYRMVDIEGNTYSTVKIGRQYWMTDNLRVQQFNNGTPLTAYYYNDDPANVNTFGLLYTWDTMMNENDITPDGWRLFSYDDFYSMFQYIGTPAGQKLKANELWTNLGNNNSDITGFHGIPGGFRQTNGSYTNIYNNGHWWSTTRGGGNPTTIRLSYDNTVLGTPTDYPVTYAQSVRFMRE